MPDWNAITFVLPNIHGQNGPLSAMPVRYSKPIKLKQARKRPPRKPASPVGFVFAYLFIYHAWARYANTATAIPSTRRTKPNRISMCAPHYLANLRFFVLRRLKPAAEAAQSRPPPTRNFGRDTYSSLACSRARPHSSHGPMGIFAIMPRITSRTRWLFAAMTFTTSSAVTGSTPGNPTQPAS